MLLDAVLKKYPLNKVTENNNGLVCACPFHKNGKEKKPSFSMNKDGLWICFSGCGQGNLYQFIQRYTGLPANKAYMEAENLTGSLVDEPLGERGFVDRPAQREKERKESEAEFEFLQKFYSNFRNNYLEKRGINRATQKAFKVGYDPDNSRIVLPVFDKGGKLRGFQYRGTDSKFYQTAKGFSKNSWLFGEHLYNKRKCTPWIVEGPTDAMWLYQKGFLGLATMGLKFSKTQADRLQKLGYNKVLLAYDNDEAGFEAIVRAKEILGGQCDVYVMDYSKMYKKDWFGMTKKQLLYMLSTAELAI